jgi:NAD(P) transhydrogenase subunit alpha
MNLFFLQAAAEVAKVTTEMTESVVPQPHVSQAELFMLLLTAFALAVFVGVEIITKIPPTLHTPLMSGSNAISGITVVGAILAAGAGKADFAGFLGFIAIILAMVNVVGGFLVTHRLLEKFKRS